MIRDNIIEYLNDEFMGPPLDSDHELDYQEDYPPYKSFLTGMLFPQDSEPEYEESEDIGSLGQDLDPLNLSHSYLTSNIGMSICIGREINELDIKLGAAFYELETINEEKKWIRKTIPQKDLIVKSNQNSQIIIFDNRARLDIRVSEYADQKIITITVINIQMSDSKTQSGKLKILPEHVLHRLKMEVSSSKGICPYPKVFKSTYDSEEEEQRILFRNEFTFAIGHSCSVDWNDPLESKTSLVRLNFLPVGITKKSKSLMEEYIDSKSINLKFLSFADKNDVIEELKSFARPYKSWINDVLNLLENLDFEEFSKTAADNLKDKLIKTEKRILEGINFLERNNNAFQAFQFANRAMLMQMSHENLHQTLRKLDSNISFEKDNPYVSDFQNIDYSKESSFNWYPFQLGFFLLACESVAINDHQDREIVDLIWFATGGGKTEAYLLVSAYLIFFNRLSGINKNCSEIIMRYTLSLLTQDQFVRSTRIILACEKLRRDHSSLGETVIDIGLWIGGEGVPNKIAGEENSAASVRQELINQSQPNNESPFILGSCPWCNTNLVPKNTSDDGSYGFKINEDQTSFKVFCPSKNCEFHEGLPVQIIDEMIYKKSPTFLLGTIDKFAQFALKPQAKNLLAYDDDCVSLIIQDELHLISGPLGTIAGIYEAAFDTVIRHAKFKPKYLAATATIRGAELQIKNLYARTIHTFPPSGITHKDRFFSREDEEDPGRAYLGIMSQGHTAIYTTVLIGAAALQSTEEINAKDIDLDGYKTLVIYHNAKKEKSKTLMLAGDDIPKRIEVIGTHPRSIRPEAVKELSADITKSEAFEVKRRLAFTFDNPASLDVVAVTSMLSVGVDIPRLGLMQVTGQPRQTSEFIQASSRVGRGKSPGLVLVNYIAGNTRDRSHYEQFYSYINSLNRFVEPTSVTPGTEAALRRVMPSIILILSRIALGLEDNSDVGNFNISSNETQEVFTSFKERLSNADPDELSLIESIVDEHIDELQKFNDEYPNANKFWFSNGGNPTATGVYLGKNFGDQTSNGKWSILQSMRHVDTEIEIKLPS